MRHHTNGTGRGAWMAMGGLALALLWLIAQAGCQGGGLGGGPGGGPGGGGPGDGVQGPPLPDPPAPASWTLDRAAATSPPDGVREIESLAVGPDGQPVALNRFGLILLRGGDGRWSQPSLDALLAPYATPRGEWSRAFVDGNDLVVVGALGFYNGGAVRLHDGTWSIDYDELKDTAPGIIGGPFAGGVRAPSGATWLFAPDTTLVARDPGGSWVVRAPTQPDPSHSVWINDVALGGDGTVVAVGSSVLVWNGTGAPDFRPVLWPGAPALSLAQAVWDGARLCAVGTRLDSEIARGVIVAGRPDELAVYEVPNDVPLTSVTRAGSGDLWAVGRDVVLRSTTTDWRPVQAPPLATGVELRAVVAARDGIYVGASDGSVWRWGR